MHMLRIVQWEKETQCMSEASPQVPTSGQVLSKTGPVSYRVELENGRVCRHHQDHVRPCQERSNTELTTESTDISPTLGESTSDPWSGSLPGSDATPVTTCDSLPDAEQDSNSEEQSKYPSRDRRPPDCYESAF